MIQTKSAMAITNTRPKTTSVGRAGGRDSGSVFGNGMTRSDLFEIETGRQYSARVIEATFATPRSEHFCAENIEPTSAAPQTGS